MSNEPTLAATVHYKGRKYRGGMTAEQIGAVAGELGDHVWVDGVAPAKAPAQGSPDGGTPKGSPPVPAPSALPTPAVAAAPEPGDVSDDGGTETPKRGRRGGA